MQKLSAKFTEATFPRIFQRVLYTFCQILNAISLHEHGQNNSGNIHVSLARAITIIDSCHVDVSRKSLVAEIANSQCH